jgi:hypothetical protein
MTEKKLTQIQKDEIILKHSQGITAYKLAKEYNVTRQYIGYIVNPDKLARNRDLERSKPDFAERNRARRIKSYYLNK